jgi:hypothetical protein
MTPLITPGFWFQLAAAVCFGSAVGFLLIRDTGLAAGFLAGGVLASVIGMILVGREEAHGLMDALQPMKQKGEED